MIQQIFISIPVLLLSFASHASDCIATPHRTTGTHYKPVSVEKTDIGKGVMFRGQVVTVTDCAPVAGAKVAHWQSDTSFFYY